MFNVLLLLITVIKCGVSLVVDCTYEFEGVEYDFSPLLLRDYKDIFTFYGDSQTDVENTLYWYNIICGNITSTPNVESCHDPDVRSALTPVLPLGYCPNTIVNGICSTNLTDIDPPVAAYQVENNLCYRLHDGVTPPTFTLVNETNPLSGIHIKYINGDFCAAGNTNRDSNIIIFCNDSNINASYIAYEKPTCTYILQISSVFGCPKNCVNYTTNQVCSGRGNCVYDNNGAHCSCNQGWNGDLCTNEYQLPADATVATNDVPSTKKREKKWPRWLGILLAFLAGAFLCCCIAALLGWLMALKKNKSNNYSNIRHAHPTPVTRTEYVPARQEEI